MNEHDAIRDLLPLAVAGALDPEEQARLQRHLAVCAACSADLDHWSDLAGALRRLPTPLARVELVERVRSRMEQELAAETERRSNRPLLAFLVLFSWTLTLASWLVVRLLSLGALAWLEFRMNSTWIWLAGTTALGWVVAGLIVMALGLRGRSQGRVT